ncbi:MAG TPA: hypothetical protein VIE13_12685 [Terriglobales bacterium]
MSLAIMLLATTGFDVVAAARFGVVFVPFFALFVLLQGFVVFFFLQSYLPLSNGPGSPSSEFRLGLHRAFLLLTLASSAVALVGIAIAR